MYPALVLGSGIKILNSLTIFNFQTDISNIMLPSNMIQLLLRQQRLTNPLTLDGGFYRNLEDRETKYLK